MAFASSGALAEEIYQYHMDQARKNMDRTWKDEYAELVPQEEATNYFLKHDKTFKRNYKFWLKQIKKPAGMRKNSAD